MRNDTRVRIARCAALLMASAITGMITSGLCSTIASGQAPAAMRPDPAAPYARYRTPGACAQVVTRRERQFWYDQRPDTAYHAPMGDRAQPSSVTAVRDCLAHFASASIAPIATRDLLGLGAAQLAAEWPERADSTFQRRLAAASTPFDRAWTLSQIVGLNAGATGQMSRALTYARQLDALGAAAAPARLTAYLAIVRKAQFADSLALLDVAVTGALAASRALVGDSAKQYAPLSASAYLALADLQSRLHQPGQAIATIQQARATLVPLRPSVQRILAGAELPYTLYGKRFPPIQASTWFGGEGAATARPRRGRLSLLVFGTHDCGGSCYPGYAVLRRLVAKYASAGLDVTWMTRTLGFYQNQRVPPDSEVALIHQYYTQVVGLPPMTLAVWNTLVEKSRKDGRTMIPSIPNDEVFRPRSNTPLPVVLVDQDGVIQCISWLRPNFEALLDHQLAAMRSMP